MKFRAKLQMEMKTADQRGVVTLSFVPLDAGVPQMTLSVSPAAAAGMEVGRIYSITAEVEPEDEAA